MFYYLASPYSKYPDGIEEAFKVACRGAATLIRAGVPVYSPIAHTHPIAIHGAIDPYDHSIWLPADEPLMHSAKGLVVLMARSWKDSRGVGFEIGTFEEIGKPIFYMDPYDIPDGLK